MAEINTVLQAAGRPVTVAPGGPTVLIGERINPTGKKKLTAALLAGDLTAIAHQALAQVAAGADVLDVNVGAAGVDEVDLLPRAVRLVMETVDVPLCIDTPNADALAAALSVHRELAPQGRPLVNSVNGKEASLAQVLPLVAEYGAAVIGLCMDDDGIPTEAQRRLAVAHKIVERAGALGIPRGQVVIDCMALTMGADARAGTTTLEAIRLVRQELGVNMTLGVSNISFGLPEREVVNASFLAMAIMAGVTCPIVDAARMALLVRAADLALGRDSYAMRYIKAFRQRGQG